MKSIETRRNMRRGRPKARPLARIGVLAVSISLVAAGYTLAAVSGTKHNFSSFSAAEVKTGETSEICVFCHTPHNSNPSGPIWNKQDVGSTYNVYESQTLAATMSPNAPTLGQPSGSSKLCLACHDGTIAVGSLLNKPGKAGLGGSFAVTGPGITAGKISSTSTSFIGTDLRDDHPISFNYSQAYPSNPEIKDSLTLPAAVKLDSAGKVQCTSCHDPHGSAFPKFMVATLEAGGLCQACHDKRYWNTNPSVHSTSTATWNEAGVNPWHEDMGTAGFADDTPQMQSCLACHSSHKGVSGKTLLKGTNPGTSQVEGEEWTCLNCHNGNVASKNVEGQFSYPYRHDVKGTTGLHIPSRSAAGDPARETAANLGANRHAECADCHNGHGAKSGSHAVGGVNGNIIGPNVLGSWGVKPTWASAGNQSTTYTVVDFSSLNPGADNLEGYLCVKCHSYYSYGALPPNVPSGNANGSLVLQSDPTADFNINNMGIHPVFAQGKNAPPSTANPNWVATGNGLGLTNTFRYVDFPGGTRDGFYNMTHDSTTTCTDCHASSVSGDPSGAHGSNEKWIVRRNETGVGSLQNFCYNCHRRNVYGDEGFVGADANFSRVAHPVDGLGTGSPFYQAGANTGNNGNKFGILCLSCHGGAYDSASNQMKGIHGSNAAAGPSGDPLGYRIMNGACVESHTRATTLTGVQMTFRSVTVATDEVCNYNFTNFTGNAAQYNCNTIGDCSN